MIGRILQVVFLSTIFATGGALGQTGNEDPGEFNVRASSQGLLSTAEGAEFTIEKGMADKLYESAVRPEARAQAASLGLSIALEGGQLVPSQWRLANSYYETDLSGQLEAMNSAGIRMALAVRQGARTTTSAFLVADHAARQGVYKVRSVSGVVAKAELDVNATTVRAGFENIWRLGATSIVRPLARIDAGVTRITQKGSLDGLDHVATVPRGGLSLGGAFWPGAWEGTDAGFDGIIVTAGYTRGGASDRQLAGLTWDAGARLAF